MILRHSTVVGKKGERRLVKRFADREVERLRTMRGRGTAARKLAIPTRARGATNVVRNRRGADQMVGEDEAEGASEVERTMGRTRLNSRRTRENEEDPEILEEMPATKH
jgi:hypothetical protein